MTLGIGIIGCGNVLSAYWAQAQDLALRGMAEVVAACGRTSQRELVEKELGVRRFVLDYRELLADDRVNLVLVLTPTPTHFEIAREALRAGKHVLSEKPMAMTLDQADELVETARTSPGLYVPAPFTMLSPTYQAIARHLHRGDIGRVGLARGRYGWSGPWWTEWFYQPGGGPLLDLAVYNITSLTGWLGPAQRVMAMTGIVQPQRIVEGRAIDVATPDNVQLVIDFGDSCFAVVTSGFVMQQYRGPALELYGTEGTLQMLGDDWDPDGYELWQNEVGAWKVYKETDPAWPWAAGLAHLVECILQGTRPLATPEHARHVLEIMLAAEASGRDGTAKEVKSRFDPLPLAESAVAEPTHLMHDRTRQEFADRKSHSVDGG